MTDNEQSDTVAEVIDARIAVYGDPTVTFRQIATMWSGYLGAEVVATDVPLMLAQMKMVRTRQAPDYSDNSDDIEGYLDIFRKLVGEDMIHARSVPEYVAQKWPRPNGSIETLPHLLDGQDPEVWRCTGCDWAFNRTFTTEGVGYSSDRTTAEPYHASFHGGQG